MNFSSSHEYVPEESLGKNFKKFLKTVHVIEKRKSHTHTRTHTQEIKQNKKRT